MLFARIGLGICIGNYSKRVFAEILIVIRYPVTVVSCFACSRETKLQEEACLKSVAPYTITLSFLAG